MKFSMDHSVHSENETLQQARRCGRQPGVGSESAGCDAYSSPLSSAVRNAVNGVLFIGSPLRSGGLGGVGPIAPIFVPGPGSNGAACQPGGLC